MPCIHELQSPNSIFNHRKIDIVKITQMEFARKTAAKMGHELISYIRCGSYGSAFKLSGHMVLKLTTDLNEVYTANQLIGKKNEFIVNYHDVKKIESNFIKNKNLYAIIMDYLFVLEDERSCLFFDYFLNNFKHEEEFFKQNAFNQEHITKRIQHYKEKNEKILNDSIIKKYINNLKNIAVDVKQAGIYPVDIHSGNLGSKVIGGDLVYFDVGANKNYNVVPIDKIVVL